MPFPPVTSAQPTRPPPAPPASTAQSPAAHPGPSLATALPDLPGITPKRLQALLDLGIKNLGQLIAYLPMRHEREEAESPLKELAPGSNAAARGIVTATRYVARGKPRFEVVLEDGTARLDLVWFNAPYLRGKITPGMKLLVQGKAATRGIWQQMVNPKWTVIHDESPGNEPAMRDERLRPVYPASEAISSAEIERIIRPLVPVATAQIEDHFTPEFRKAQELLELATAYRMMHQPANLIEASEARRRLAYDELFLFQLGIAQKRSERAAMFAAPVLKCTPAINAHIRGLFPFTLTPDQSSVIETIVSDCTKAVPANRLIQGDVGSGKTAVAVYAMLLAVANGHQAAIMAPTEILAEQHATSIGRLLKDSKVRIKVLTGSLGTVERREILAGLAVGSVDLIIGTHALLAERVVFKSLAVAVIDEQHKFGVHQRAVLRDKGIGPDPASEGPLLQAIAAQQAKAAKSGKPGKPTTPHTLVMTATPIPRTLAMTLFGDLDVSTIKHLPPGRKPVATRVVGSAMATEVYAFVRKRIEAGEQAFIVVPAIENAADDDEAPGTPSSVANGAAVPLASIKSTSERLERTDLSGIKFGVVHGQMPSAERDATMQAFRDGKLGALLATTVIEVGVDVPNATVMVIENADRFGLAQLHQLRGRVGRGANNKASACVLIADPITADGNARLAVMAATGDGFKLAEKDLEIRGFGELVGIRQSGMPPFRVADLVKDLELLLMARRDAQGLIERDPALVHAEHATLRRRLHKAHGKWLGLADVG